MFCRGAILFRDESTVRVLCAAPLLQCHVNIFSISKVSLSHMGPGDSRGSLIRGWILWDGVKALSVSKMTLQC